MAEQVNNFRDLYSTDLAPKLANLEKVRKKIFAHIKKQIHFSLAPLAISGYLSVTYHTPIPVGLIAAAFVIFSYFKIKPLWSKYRSEFKKQIIKEIVHFIDDGLKYSPTDAIIQSRFKECGIFNTGIDRYRGDDLVTGTIGETDIEFSEVHAEYKTQTTDGKGPNASK